MCKIFGPTADFDLTSCELEAILPGMKSAGEMFADWIERRFDGNQVKAAKELGISPALTSYLKTNGRAPGRALAIRIQEATGIPVTAWASSPVHTSKKQAKKSKRLPKSSQGVNANV